MFFRCWSTAVLCAAVSGVLAGPASAALPEFSKTGAGLKAEFTSSVIQTNERSLSLKCGATTLTGEITGPKTIGNYKEVYKNCLSSGELRCSSKGAAEGEIKSEALSGEIGYVKASSKEVGLRTESSKGRMSAMDEFSCSTLKIAIEGAVIGTLGPVDTEATKLELVRSGSEGVQSIKRFEGGEEEVLSALVAGTTLKCDLTSSGTITVSTPVKILA